MTNKFTPGPWIVEPKQEGQKAPWIMAGEKYVGFSGGTTSENADANARLIAAAPEMLELLKFLSDQGYGDIKKPFLDKIESLLNRIDNV